MDCWLSFSCKDGLHISDGTPIRECGKIFGQIDAVQALGINCTAPQYVNSLIVELRASANKPIIVYPNSGEEYDPEEKAWHGSTNSVSFAKQASQWKESGATIIGGCCRTTPKDIEEIAHWLDSIN